VDPHVVMPSNSTSWEREVTRALGDELDIGIIQRVKDPETCPADLLPYLAAEESLDLWNATWPEAVKRTAISGSWAFHRRKGTPAAMDDTVAGLGPGWSWAEWFQYGGQPYRFRLSHQIGEAGLSFDTFLAARDRVYRTKNVRSIMDFRAETAAAATAFVGVFASVARFVGDLATTVPAVDVYLGAFSTIETFVGDVE